MIVLNFQVGGAKNCSKTAENGLILTLNRLYSGLDGSNEAQNLFLVMHICSAVILRY